MEQQVCKESTEDGTVVDAHPCAEGDRDNHVAITPGLLSYPEFGLEGLKVHRPTRNQRWWGLTRHFS